MKSFGNKLINEERASTIIEYTIVLPIVFFSIALLILMGYIECQKSVMEAAVYRGAIKASKMIADPHYAEITEGYNSKSDPDITSYNLKKANYSDNKPYRYMLGNLDGMVSGVKDEVASYIGTFKLFNDNSSTGDSGVQIDVKTKNLFVYQTVTVSAAQSFRIPVAFGIYHPELMKLQAQAVVAVSDAPEFIRNSDLVVDVARQTVEKYKLAEKFERVQEFIAKLFR